MVANFLFRIFNNCMKIMPINEKTPIKQPSFGTCFRRYPYFRNKEFKHFSQSVIRTSTNFFREDIDWQKLAKYVISHFKDKTEVKAYSLACSDLSEAYTYSISIMENTPKELHKKFLPVYASDIDSEILKMAQSDRVNIYNSEFATTEKLYNIHLDNYLKDSGVSISIKGDRFSDTDEMSSYRIIPILKSSVITKKSDILTELSSLRDDGNSVIMCRNVFPYLSSKYINNVLEIASAKLKSGCLFVIGEYDKRAKGIDKELLLKGFFNPLKDDFTSLIFEKR